MEEVDGGRRSTFKVAKRVRTEAGKRSLFSFIVFCGEEMRHLYRSDVQPLSALAPFSVLATQERLKKTFIRRRR
jgi:hypothetical protein